MCHCSSYYGGRGYGHGSVNGLRYGHGGFSGLRYGHGGINGLGYGHGGFSGLRYGYGGINGLGYGHGGFSGLRYGHGGVRGYGYNHRGFSGLGYGCSCGSGSFHRLGNHSGFGGYRAYNYACVGMCTCVLVPVEDRRGIGVPGAEVTSSYRLSIWGQNNMAEHPMDIGQQCYIKLQSTLYIRGITLVPRAAVDGAVCLDFVHDGFDKDSVQTVDKQGIGELIASLYLDKVGQCLQVPPPQGNLLDLLYLMADDCSCPGTSAPDDHGTYRDFPGSQFRVTGFMLRSLIHLDLSFVHGDRDLGQTKRGVGLGLLLNLKRSSTNSSSTNNNIIIIITIIIISSSPPSSSSPSSPSSSPPPSSSPSSPSSSSPSSPPPPSSSPSSSPPSSSPPPPSSSSPSSSPPSSSSSPSSSSPSSSSSSSSAAAAAAAAAVAAAAT
ncbi:hypothetical protein STEG23_003486 [Scotinomys teguina]